MIDYVQMTFVIQGKEIAEKVDLKAEIKLAVIRVLETVHLPPEFGKWKLKTKDGKEISMTRILFKTQFNQFLILMLILFLIDNLDNVS